MLWGALLGSAGLAAFAAAAWFATRDDQNSASEGSKPGPFLPVIKGPPSDAESLARMLASEDNRSYGARVVIAWITKEKARKSGKSLYSFLTKGKGWGRQERDGETFYASTAGTPDPNDYQMAADVLSGKLQPSETIRKAGTGGWFERDQLSKQTGQSITKAQEDAKMLEKQGDWSEGIYGRIKGTKWFLYSGKYSILAEPMVKDVIDWKLKFKKANSATEKETAQSELNKARAILAQVATQVLDGVPEVEAT